MSCRLKPARLLECGSAPPLPGAGMLSKSGGKPASLHTLREAANPKPNRACCVR